MIEERKKAAAPPIRGAEQHRAVRAAHVLWFYQSKVGGVLDAAGGISRSVLDVDDDLVCGIVGIGFEVDRSDELLVGADEPERPAAEHVRLVLDLHARNFCRCSGSER